MCAGSADALIRAFLVVINIVFGTLGALMVVCGGILLGGKDLIQGDVAEILGSIPKLNKVVGLTNDVGDTPVMDMGQLLMTAAIAFIVLGGILFIISFMGCIAGCCANRTIIVIYLLIICLLFICQLCLAVLFFLGIFNAMMKATMEDGFNAHYAGSDSADSFSAVFNFMQLEMKCCGVNGGSDYKNATKWSGEKSTNKGEKVYKVPVTCCKMNGTFPDVTPQDERCPEMPTNENSYYNTGCWDGLRTWVVKYAVPTVVVVCVALSIQFYLIMSTSMLLCLKKGGKDEKE